MLSFEYDSEFMLYDECFDEELIPEFKKFASLVASNLCKISESSVWGWNQVKRAIFSLKQHLQTALCVLNQVSFIIYSKMSQ